MTFNSLVASLGLAMLAPLSNLFAADFVVDINGTYTSIQAAITAASNGDRIIVRNQAGSVPWLGNFTINKTLDILSYDNDVQFLVQGTITIDQAAGRVVNIIGMNNQAGSIVSGTGTGATKINIADCLLQSGNINIVTTNTESNIYSSTLQNGYINIQYGDVIGCNIQVGYLAYSNGYALTPANANYIVGNKMSNNTGSSYIFNYSGAGQIAPIIKNNYIACANYYVAGMYISYNPTAPTDIYVHNNTIAMYGSNSSSYYPTALYLGLGNSARLYLQNNILECYGYSYGYGIDEPNGSTFFVHSSYNYIDYDFPTSEIRYRSSLYNANGTALSSFNLNTGGVLPGGHPAINGGDPQNKFADLDLSRNDAGCYGGSYTHANFFPLHTGAARVFFVEPAATTYLQGQTLNINAGGFDR